ncbi:hypothetical protein [Lachnoclostridium sp.]|uniref:hypothetical protein n=1 Tax=Lachnoclostridium sp. TaxID=2028282 RepID=UPI00289A3A37|nr:hypothetical protein [Lachnoclostridium sp.]
MKKFMDKWKIFRQKNIIVSLVVVVAGLICLSISNDYVQSIGSILLISGIYSIIESYYLKKSMIDVVIEKVKLDNSINETGLLEVGANLGDIHYQDYFKSANANIDILHVYARTWTNTNYDFIKEVVVHKKCKLRVVLLNPDSPFIPALEKHYEYSVGDLAKYINEVTQQWKSLAKIVEEKHKFYTDKAYRRAHRISYKTKEYGSVELYYHNGQPANSLYRIDDNLITVSTKTSKDRSVHIPYMIYKKNNNATSMYDMYLSEMDKVIEEAKKVNLLGENEEQV